MKTMLYIYIATLVTLAILDAAYLSTLGVKLFKQQLGPGMLRQRPVAAAAVLFYLLYVLGVVYFVIAPNLDQNLAAIALRAAALGFLAYGTYDLTNMATLERWTWVIVALDMLWGTLVTAAAAAAGGFMAHWLN